MTRLYIHHRPDSDRDALVAYLQKHGHAAETVESLGALRRALEAEPQCGAGRVVILQVSALEDGADLAFLGREPTLFLGGRAPAAAGAAAPREALPEPYFLEDLRAAVERLGEARRVPVTTRPGPPEDLGPLLRALGHALNNPLSAALGWLQILGTTEGQDAPSNRAAGQIAVELERLNRMAQALGVIGRSVTTQAGPVELAGIVRSQVAAARKEGLQVAFHEPGPRPLVIEADPAEIALFLELLLGSLLEERSRAGMVEIGLEERDGAAILTVSADGGVIPLDGDSGDLGALLKRTRPPRALALAIARTLAARLAGGEFSVEDEGGERACLRFRASTFSGVHGDRG